MSAADPMQAVMTWLESVTSLPSDRVRTNIPDLNVWAATGLAQVTMLPSAAEIDYPVRNSQAQIDFWAVRPNSHKPDWARTAGLSEEVVASCFAFVPVQLTVTSWAGVDPVAIMQATALTEPTPIRDDPNNWGRHTMDVQITWR